VSAGALTATSVSASTITASGTTDATTTETGVLQISGGLGVSKTAYASTLALPRFGGGTITAGTPSTGVLYLSASTGTGGFDVNHIIRYDSTVDGLALKGYTGGRLLTLSDAESMRWTTTGVYIPVTTASASTTSGALTVAGGLGVVGSAYIGGAQSITGNQVIGGNQTITGNSQVNGTFSNFGSSGLARPAKGSASSYSGS
jgi:hypothetical protein